MSSKAWKAAISSPAATRAATLLALEWSPPRPEDLLLLRRQVIALPHLAMLRPETLLVKIPSFKQPLRRQKSIDFIRFERGILSETDEVAVRILQLEFLHFVERHLRFSRDFGPLRFELPIQ